MWLRGSVLGREFDGGVEMDALTGMGPLQEVREGLGLSRQELADAIGVSYWRLCNMEVGRSRLTWASVPGLVACGIDAEELVTRNDAWLRERGEAARRVLSAKLSGGGGGVEG